MPTSEKQISVVILEDDVVLLSVLKSKLEKEGFEVFSAMDGENGLNVIRNKRPDVILLDIIMPKMDGFAVMEVLHNDPELSKIPVIIVSNSGQPVEIDRALALGVKDYLIKTEFDPQEVIDKIRKQFPLSSTLSQQQPAFVLSEQTEHDIHSSIGQFSAFKILLIEDDKFLRNLIYQKMVKEGLSVIEAVDGEDGVQKAKENRPHLILLDLILPGIDGFDALKLMRSDQNINKTPVIILSNLGQKEDIDKGKALGIVDYMVKAYNTPAEIVAKVKDVLSKSYINI